MNSISRQKLEKISNELDLIIEGYLEIVLSECGPRVLLALLSSIGTTLLGDAIILTKLDEENPPTTDEIGELLTLMLKSINEKSLQQERIDAMHDVLLTYGFVADHKNPYICRPSH